MEWDEGTHADRLALLGRIASKVGHSVNNSLAGALGLLDCLSPESDPAEWAEDLAVCAESIGAASRLVKGFVELATGTTSFAPAELGDVLDRVMKVAMALKLPRCDEPDVPAPTRALRVPGGAVEHALLATLAMAADRAVAPARLTIRCEASDEVDLAVECAPIKASEKADRLDDLQLPRWRNIMSAVGGHFHLERREEGLRVRVTCPVVELGDERKDGQ